MSEVKTIGRLHVITDEVLQTTYTHQEIAELAVAGGADAVQLREKRNSLTSKLISTSSDMLEICESNNAQLVVDDRVDVAAAVGAPAVHLGRNDLPVAVARRILGEEAVIGGTANSLEEAIQVSQTSVDYIGVGPIYGTKSKENPAPDMGLNTLRQIVSQCKLPIIAIGSIKLENVEEVLETGAHGVAVLSGITCDPDPENAARQYRRKIDQFFGSEPHQNS